MSTVEGGMICTNNKKIYEICLMLRSHGMVREAKNKKFEKKMQEKYPELSPKFIFLYPAYNVRNTEIPAVIGLSQLKRLDKNNKIRRQNLALFLKLLDNKKYFVNFDLKGNSNYAFPLILIKRNLKNRNKLEKLMVKQGIEFRRGNAGGGNQLRQPYLKSYTKNKIKKFSKCRPCTFLWLLYRKLPIFKKNKNKKNL